ncbi:MAG TPA: hypothetical protein VK400_15620 [Pyrinomonadaceae bacterium]|nr:hypothetical protein [Pyrinomonadaceae bacterium]
MTTTKGKIKVIKKGTQPTTAVTEAPQSAEIEKKSTKAAAREMVSNVSSWVTEFQQRKRVETRSAIEQFFSQQPQANSV